MVEKLVDYYRSEIWVDNVVYKNMKGINIWSNISILSIFILFFLPIILFFNQSIYSVMGIIIYAILAILNLSWVTKKFRNKAASIIENRGVQNVEPARWSGEPFEEWQQTELTKHLQLNDLLNRSKLEYLITLLNKKIQSPQDSPNSQITTWFSFFSPSLGVYLSLLYTNTKENLTLVFVATTIFTFIGMLLVLGSLKTLRETKSMFFDKENQMLKELVSKLEDAILRLPSQ